MINDDVKQFISIREAKNELIIANVSPTDSTLPDRPQNISSR